MPKEVIAAIIVGGLLGVAIAFGVWRANIALSPQENSTTGTSSPTAQTPPEPSAPVALSLTITNPQDDSVVNTSSTVVEGLADPNATISITTDKSETIVTADGQGKFSGKVELSEGPNVITVTMFTKEAETIEKQIIVVYSTEIR